MKQQSENERPMRVLLLEDSDYDAELVREHLRPLKPTPEIVRAVGRGDYLTALTDGRYDVILSDYSLPGFDGLAALDLAIQNVPATPFIFVSGVLGEEIAVEALRNGATDYVLKQRLIRLPVTVARAVAEARERAERHRVEEQRKLLVAELSHRVKNTLAAVMSLVKRTAKSSRNVGDFEGALMSRLRALSDAHALLFEVNWSETDLAQVLSRTVEPFRRGDGDAAVRLAGPQVKVEPKTALALSLIFHELMTNAVKYGALSKEKGRVCAEWVLDGTGNGRVKLVWTESGGPAVTTPGQPGFGTHLIERSARYELDGEARLLYQESGVVCELDFATMQA
jgi:two-component sensor histidine kinase